jgi:hypothetical protein
MLCLTVIGLFLNGCGGSGQGGYSSAVMPVAGSGSSGGKGRFTIMLAQYTQMDQVQKAQELQQRAKKLLNSDDVWLEHSLGSIIVNYGHFDNNTPNSQAGKELERVVKLYSSMRAGAYQFCYIREIAPPDPPAPQEWDLLKSDCFLSLEIATYYDVPEKNYFNRKADAVQAVRNLRAEGVEAYFVHGRFESRIYAGCLPPTSLQIQWVDNERRLVWSPAAQLLRQKYQFHDNGSKIFDVTVDRNNRKIRKPRRGVLMKVSELVREVPY